MRHLLILLALAAGALAFPAHAASDRVVAIVNDQVITESTVRARALLLERQMGAKNLTPAEHEILAKRTLASLIDEELAKQYADSLKISVSDAELKAAVADLSKNNPNFEPVTRGLEGYAGDQISGELRWNKITTQVLRPQIEVTNADVDQLINDMLKSKHVLEREISEIFMAVDDQGKEAAVRAKMQDVLAQLKAGKDFGALARSSSEEPNSASQGGSMGWFASGELNPQLEEALNAMKPGDVSGLVRTPLGFHIIRLDNVRTTTPINTAPVTQLHLVMVARPPGDKENPADALKSVRGEVIKTRQKPFEVTNAMADAAFKARWSASSDLGWVEASNLQSALQQATQSLKVGEWSEPMSFNGNVGALYLLETRQTVSKDLESYRDRIRQHLGQNRMELASRRLIRQLREKAFVDIRW